MKPNTLLRGALALLSTGLLASPAAMSQTSGDAARYTAAPGWEGGAAVVASPYGGAYEYSADPPRDARVAQRFVLSRPARGAYVLFSTEEEQALWELRERLLVDRLQLASADAGPSPLGPKRRRSTIAWPRVVLVGDKTCVPRLEFSELPDWHNHLICWIPGEKRVE